MFLVFPQVASVTPTRWALPRVGPRVSCTAMCFRHSSSISRHVPIRSRWASATAANWWDWSVGYPPRTNPAAQTFPMWPYCRTNRTDSNVAGVRWKLAKTTPLCCASWRAAFSAVGWLTAKDVSRSNRSQCWINWRRTTALPCSTWTIRVRPPKCIRWIPMAALKGLLEFVRLMGVIWPLCHIPNVAQKCGSGHMFRKDLISRLLHGIPCLLKLTIGALKSKSYFVSWALCEQNKSYE